MTGESYGRYFASSVHGFPHFQHAGSAPAGVPDMGFLVSGIGMAPAAFVMPEGELQAAGYGAPTAVPVEIPVAGGQPMPALTHAGAVAPCRGVWTDEEDEILKKMVMELGDRKWAAIAQHLPAESGSSAVRDGPTTCAPTSGIHVHSLSVYADHLEVLTLLHIITFQKENIWTEDDDKVLIEAHKIYGNRWSAIARCLPGRSENSVKNHWNATKRSLKSKRRLKKKKSEQAGPGQLTLLEEYIRGNTPATQPTAPPTVSSPPSSLGYGDPAGSHSAAHGLTGSSPPGMGLYLQPANAARSSSYGGTMNLNSPSLPDLNAYGGEMQERFYHSSTFPPYNNLHYGLQEPFPAPALPLMFSAQEHLQAACMNLNLFPIADQNLASNVEFEGQSSEMAYGVGHYDSETGPSSAGGSSDPDDDVVQMASREFLTPSEDEVTLNLTRFE
ncbi:hypothetical protein ACQ4PT_069638 [Festuca glaucescens]